MFKENPRDNIDDAYPIIWSDKPSTGTLSKPFPGKILIIIALDDLDENNGLPSLTTEHLTCGDFVVLSGDDDMSFKKNGGGMAFLILLELSTSS